MIKPTVGRVVWYYPGPNDPKPEGNPPAPLDGKLAAMITHVWSDHGVNLVVFDVNGGSFGRTSVPLLQDSMPETTDKLGCCEWMPYQKGQAAKTEALEQKLHNA